ncbi:hypothetical protein F5X98DRAFT_386937 [Xylaria grammica]|nr:hypothetical protein F5X98DRAFT_386937 [Xylaria grammica]
MVTDLVNILSEWHSSRSPPPFLIYPLDKNYEQKPLGLNNLEGLDHARARYMANVCDRHGEFSLFLGQITHHGSWLGDETASSPIRDYFLREVSTLQGLGMRTGSNVLVSASTILNQSDYSLVPACSHTRKEEYGYEVPAELYNNTVIIIVQKECLANPLISLKYHPTHFATLTTCLRQGLQQNVKGSDGHEAETRILRQLCRNFLGQTLEEGGAQDPFLGHVAVIAAILPDRNILREACQKTHNAWEVKSCFALGQIPCIIDPQDSPVDQNE